MLACPSCTLLNPSNSQRCAACNGSLSSGFKPGPWSCKQCTYVNQQGYQRNPASLTHCEMCAAPREIEETRDMSINQSAVGSDDDFGDDGEGDWGDFVEDDGLKEDDDDIKESHDQSDEDDEDGDDDSEMALPIHQSNNQSNSQSSKQSTEVELTDSLLQQMYALFTETAKMLHKSTDQSINQSTNQPNSQSKRIRSIIDEIYITLNIQAQMNELAKQPANQTFKQSIKQSIKQSNNQSYKPPSQCQVCFSEFTSGAQSNRVTVPVCGHSTMCTDCFNQFLNQKIDSGDVLPWLKCGEPDCKQVIHAALLYPSNNQSINQSIKFIYTYLCKYLARSPAFVPCKTINQTAKCEFAFLQLKSAKEKMTCSICKVPQEVERGMDGELDPEFKKWIAEGTMRACPKCEHWTVKEKGVCNVIQCAKCGIHWNWLNKQTGRDAAELKNRARMNGTLWMPGELEYQLNLERTNPKEFKALLERNGQKYDPHYRRGGY